MKNIFIEGTNFAYELQKKANEKTGKIVVYTLVEKEVETERKEIRTVIEEQEKEREVRNRETGEMELEPYIERVAVRKEIPIVEMKIETKPKKFGEIDVYTFLWPHQEKETVKEFIQSKMK